MNRRARFLTSQVSQRSPSLEMPTRRSFHLARRAHLCDWYADAIITDARGFHLPPGKDHKLPLSEKLRLQLSWDTQVFELAPHLKKDVVPRDVIDLFDKQMAKEGWQMCVSTYCTLSAACVAHRPFCVSSSGSNLRLPTSSEVLSLPRSSTSSKAEHVGALPRSRPPTGRKC